MNKYLNRHLGRLLSFMKKILFFIIIGFLFACGRTKKSMNLPTHRQGFISTKDMSQDYEVKLALVDSFTYRLPESVAIPHGKAYVYGNERYYLHASEPMILRFDEKGNQLTKIETYGIGEFTHIVELAFDSIYIYALGRRPNQLNIYDRQGNLHKIQKWDLEQLCEDIEPQLGGFFYDGKGKFLFPIACRSYRYLEAYENPFIGAVNTEGKLLNTFGKWDSIYTQTELLYHLKYQLLFYDSLTQHLLVSLQASHLTDIYDSSGNLLRRFGRPGRHMNNPEFSPLDKWPDYSEDRDAFFSYTAKLIFETSAYWHILASEDYYIRFYRNAISYEDKPEFTWEKPLYYQIYDRSGNLLADQKAPKDWMFPRGIDNGNHLWFSYEDVYWHNPPNGERPHKFHHTIYKYNIQVTKIR